MDPLMGVFDPPQQLGVPPWFLAYFVVHGQALGMLLDLYRRERHPRASDISHGILALRMQDEDGGRNVAAFSKYRHWEPQGFNRRLEDQDGLLGH
ncbi:MAG TPA: hypothetical protein VLZ10_04130 [Thermodesulfobacteriota bacterium]|nr:hypothetical protein [Thermodesulfobacteriota bacterium]